MIDQDSSISVIDNVLTIKNITFQQSIKPELPMSKMAFLDEETLLVLSKGEMMQIKMTNPEQIVFMKDYLRKQEEEQ